MTSVLPGVTVSIVTFNTWQRTAACIESILAGETPRAIEILVVDNGNPPEHPLSFPDHVKVTSSTTNVGFGAGHNLNLRDASFEHFLILNPDMTIPSRAVSSLSSGLSAKSEAVALAPTLRFPDGETQQSLRRFPSVRTEFSRIVGADREIGTRHSILVDPSSLTPWAELEQPAGAALIVRTEDMRAVGGFNELFPMYFEDVDLCRRLLKRGKILFAKEIVLLHDGEGTAKSHRRATTFWIEYSRRLYIKEHHDGLHRWMMLTCAALSCLSHALLHSVNALRGTSKASDQEKAAGYWLALRSRLHGSTGYWRSRLL